MVQLCAEKHKYIEQHHRNIYVQRNKGFADIIMLLQTILKVTGLILIPECHLRCTVALDWWKSAILLSIGIGIAIC